MADVIQDLLLENFRRVHERLAGIEAIMSDMRGELTSLRHHDLNLQTDQVLLGNRVVRLENQMDRVNRRLDLHEGD